MSIEEIIKKELAKPTPTHLPMIVKAIQEYINTNYEHKQKLVKHYQAGWNDGTVNNLKELKKQFSKYKTYHGEYIYESIDQLIKEVKNG